MGSFISQHKTMVIGLFLIVLVFFGYGMMKTSAPTESDGLEKTIVDPSSPSKSADDPGTEFVLQLLAIQNIKFNSEFFQDPVYRELVDQSRPLGEREVGRPNPFLNIGEDNVKFPEDIVLRNGNTANASSGLNFVPTSPTAPASSTAPKTSTSTSTSPRSGSRR